MERIELHSENRTIHGKQVKKLRGQGLVPAVVFGGDAPAMSIQVPERPLQATLQQAGSSLINLRVGDGGQPYAVLIRDVQRHPITGRLQHVDFYRVNLMEKLRTMVPIVLTGESPLVVSEDALLNRRLEQLEVECLPADLPDHITVDVSSLRGMHDEIKIADLSLPPNITVLADANEVVVSLQSGRASMVEEMAAPTPVAEEEEEEEDEG
jgi:large subunit ribosomal protein L25